MRALPQCTVAGYVLFRCGVDATVKHELTLDSTSGTVDDSFAATVVARDQFGNVVDVDSTVRLIAANTVLIPGDNGLVEGDGSVAMKHGTHTFSIRTKVPGDVTVTLKLLNPDVDEADTATISVLQG